MLYLTAKQEKDRFKIANLIEDLTPYEILARFGYNVSEKNGIISNLDLVFDEYIFKVSEKSLKDLPTGVPEIVIYIVKKLDVHFYLNFGTGAVEFVGIDGH